VWIRQPNGEAKWLEDATNLSVAFREWAGGGYRGQRGVGIAGECSTVSKAVRPAVCSSGIAGP
jgi:hypothetical protein